MTKKSKGYYFEQQRVPHKIESIKRACRARQSDKLDANQYSMSNKNEYIGYDNMMDKLKSGELSHAVHAQGKNMRAVWEINTESFRQLHFATFPRMLAEIMIKAGCPEFVCDKCGQPREKIIEKVKMPNWKDKGYKSKMDEAQGGISENSVLLIGGEKYYKWKEENPDKLLGYTDCGCGVNFSRGIVLDPFMGSGTTGLVSKYNNRQYVGIELNQTYIDMANKRIAEIMF